MAQVSEARQIADLVNSAYRGDSSRRGWTTEADLLAGQRTDAVAITELIECHQPPTQILVIDSESQSLGDSLSGSVILGCVLLEERPPKLYLGMLTVHPELQNKGFGKLLMEAAEEQAKQKNLQFIEMTVFPQREALIDYYRRQGYRLTGERRPFPAANPRFGVPKVPDLEFVVLEKKLP